MKNTSESSPRKGKRRLWIITALALMFLAGFVANLELKKANNKEESSAQETGTKEQKTEARVQEAESIPIIYDMAQFNGMSLEELNEKYGKPAREDTYGINVIYGYEVDSNYIEFTMADDKCVCATLYSGSCWWSSDHKIVYECKENDLPAAFKCGGKVSNNTGVALRATPNDKAIEDFWIQIMDQKEKTIDVVKVTYDSSKIDWMQ